jgi:phage terminase large subunit-like protein
MLAEAGRFNVGCAGRRTGKSKFGIRLTADTALAGYPCGWYSPTYRMLTEVWRETCRVLHPVTAQKLEGEHRLQLVTGGIIDMWSLENPDSSRGRKYKRIVVDEAAMVPNLLDTWNMVLRSTLIDFVGDAWFFSTPRGRNDFMALYEMGQSEAQPDWRSWRFPTSVNPYLPTAEVEAMRSTMTARAYEQEIEARFIDETTGALWTYRTLDRNRLDYHPELARVLVAIDPAVTANEDSDETGIICAGVDRPATQLAEAHGYTLADMSGVYSPRGWAERAIALYHAYEGDCIVAEANNGGDMVRYTLRTVDHTVPVKLVHASRGKAIRAEPVAALDEVGRIHHVGHFPELESQMCTWSPVDDDRSPDRVDARVWAFTELMLKRPMRVATSWQG